MAKARYKLFKDHIVNRIHSKALLPGMKIESEAELVTAFNVSRMTVNRVIRELSAEGLLRRVQGKGTFVLERKPQSPLFEVQPIDKVIASRGDSHSSYIHLLKVKKTKPVLATSMEVAPYPSVFHTTTTHA